MSVSSKANTEMATSMMTNVCGITKQQQLNGIKQTKEQNKKRKLLSGFNLTEFFKRCTLLVFSKRVLMMKKKRKRMCRPKREKLKIFFIFYNDIDMIVIIIIIINCGQCNS